MMRRNLIETVMGAVVLLVAGLFVYFAYTTAQFRAVKGYPVMASFAKLGGLPVGSDVRISGIKVGVVTARSLDPVSFNATIKMTIAETIKLPEDTVALISSEGLVGEKYVRLEPGRSTTLIPPNGMIRETRNFRSLEDQVGEIIFLATRKPGASTPPDM
jgi:phospholipid/cholesterol/gamma-HCH transport system substrate-binding protein